MTRPEGVRIAQEILGGKWDYAVRARAAWLAVTQDWNPADEAVSDLSRYEAEQDAEIEQRRAEHRRMVTLAAFGNVVAP